MMANNKFLEKFRIFENSRFSTRNAYNHSNLLLRLLVVDYDRIVFAGKHGGKQQIFRKISKFSFFSYHFTYK